MNPPLALRVDPHVGYVLGAFSSESFASFWAALFVLTRFQASCAKLLLSYIGERFGGISVGGKWLMDNQLRTPLTLLGLRKGLVGGREYFAELL